MYQLLGSQIGKAIHNLEPGDRREAVRTLVGIAATHAAMAGALGLPTEPFKYLLMGMQAVGITSLGWGDVERKTREISAGLFGKTGGEVFAHGLPRLLGIDLSTRVGLDSLTSFGEPRNNKQEEVKAWLLDTVAGAPFSLVGDWVKGANEITNGETLKGIEKLVPIKAAADSIRAYRQMTEGKKSASERQTMTPYSIREAGVRAFGFTPQREAEASARRAAFYSQQKGLDEERRSLASKWVAAKPEERGKAWVAIIHWNKGKAKPEQLTLDELRTMAKKRATEESKGTVRDGIRITRRDKHILDRADSVYNYQQ